MDPSGFTAREWDVPAASPIALEKDDCASKA
jgi:hypothetical protein